MSWVRLRGLVGGLELITAEVFTFEVRDCIADLCGPDCCFNTVLVPVLLLFCEEL